MKTINISSYSIQQQRLQLVTFAKLCTSRVEIFFDMVTCITVIQLQCKNRNVA